MATGLVKQKQYDWKDSNLALFGSETEKNVKMAAAKTEKAWETAGKAPGLQIWRIVKFKVTEWPKADYGKFYSGDSYIILNTYKKKDKEMLLYDLHFWIGKHSTQDEYGTAAYKTVELDTHLNDVPVQHREVQDHESKLFKSYFKSITLMEGGAESGFRKVKPKEYKPRLLHFTGDKKEVKVAEVPRCRDLLDHGDVYILDLGLMLIQWNGKGSNKDKRNRAMKYMKDLQHTRGGKCKKETMDDGAAGEDCAEFYDQLTESKDSMDESPDFEAKNKKKELYRVSDASGKMEIKKEKEGKIKMKNFDTHDVFLFDTKEELFVWIGKETSANEQKNALIYAHNYLMKSDHPLIPVTCVQEGVKNKAFKNSLS